MKKRFPTMGKEKPGKIVMRALGLSGKSGDEYGPEDSGGAKEGVSDAANSVSGTKSQMNLDEDMKKIKPPNSYGFDELENFFDQVHPTRKGKEGPDLPYDEEAENRAAEGMLKKEDELDNPEATYSGGEPGNGFSVKIMTELVRKKPSKKTKEM